MFFDIIVRKVIKMKKLGLTHKHLLLYIITLLVVVIGDQITKMIVDHTLQLNGSYTIIDNFFYFTYSHNKGAAWGMLQGHMYLFYVISFIAAAGMIYYFMESKEYQKLYRFGLVLVFSGMLGNLIDRVFYGYVRDFIDFIILGYDFPIFNVADMAICLGVGLILLEVGIEEYKIWKQSKLNA